MILRNDPPNEKAAPSMTSLIERPVGALHLAYLDPMTGTGLLVMPSPNADVWLDGSLNGADFDAAVRALSALGWEPSLDDDGGWIFEGQTPQGCPIVALIASEAITSRPTLQDLSESRTALLQAAGAAA